MSRNDDEARAEFCARSVLDAKVKRRVQQQQQSKPTSTEHVQSRAIVRIKLLRAQAGRPPPLEGLQGAGD
jgi:hypothetical protein